MFQIKLQSVTLTEVINRSFSRNHLNVMAVNIAKYYNKHNCILYKVGLSLYHQHIARYYSSGSYQDTKSKPSFISSVLYNIPHHNAVNKQTSTTEIWECSALSLLLQLVSPSGGLTRGRAVPVELSNKGKVVMKLVFLLEKNLYERWGSVSSAEILQFKHEKTSRLTV